MRHIAMGLLGVLAALGFFVACDLVLEFWTQWRARRDWRQLRELRRHRL
jgi:hypothetical protein